LAKALRIAARQQGSTRRPIDRRRRIPGRAAHAILRQRVDIRRRDVLAAMTADVAISEIGSGDDDDIRPPRLAVPRAGVGAKAYQDQPQKERTSGHHSLLIYRMGSPALDTQHPPGRIYGGPEATARKKARGNEHAGTSLRARRASEGRSILPRHRNYIAAQ